MESSPSQIITDVVPPSLVVFDEVDDDEADDDVDKEKADKRNLESRKGFSLFDRKAPKRVQPRRESRKTYVSDNSYDINVDPFPPAAANLNELVDRIPYTNFDYSGEYIVQINADQF